MFARPVPNAPRIAVDPLLLRPFAWADAPHYQRLINQVLAQPGMNGFLLTFPRRLSPAQTRARIRETHSWLRQNRGWSLAIALEGQMIGQAQIVTLDARQRRAEIAYWLSSAYQGQGHARRAIAALIKAARQQWPLERIEATVVPGNTPSTRLLERLGFTYHELATLPYRVQGGWRRRQAELLVYVWGGSDSQRSQDVQGTDAPDHWDGSLLYVLVKPE